MRLQQPAGDVAVTTRSASATASGAEPVARTSTGRPSRSSVSAAERDASSGDIRVTRVIGSTAHKARTCALPCSPVPMTAKEVVSARASDFMANALAAGVRSR
jgi:hypothetical protein